jgi:hypothetical protein
MIVVCDAVQLCATQIHSRNRQFMRSKLRNLNTTNNEPLFVLVKNHVLQSDDGKVAISQNQLENQFRVANHIWKSGDIQFVLLDTNIISNNDWFDYQAGEADEELYDTFADPRAINLYWMNTVSVSATEVCGYAYLPPDVPMAILSSDIACLATTLPHEIGHVLGLLHTHESGNELVDGSNCQTAGDLVCDTPADPILRYSNVDSSCRYYGNARDVNGQLYRPDTKNIMSYSRKECRTALTPGQFRRVRTLSLEDSRRRVSIVAADFTVPPGYIEPGTKVELVGYSSVPGNFSWGLSAGLRWDRYQTGVNPKVDIILHERGINRIEMKVCFDSLNICISRVKDVMVGRVSPPSSAKAIHHLSFCILIVILFLLL